MGEAERTFFPEPVENKEEGKSEREKSIENIRKHIQDINDFFHGRYVTQTRKQEFGFHRPEQFEALKKIKELKDRLEELSKNDVEIAEYSHLDHILGNSITTSAGGFAKRFEEGKYFSKDGEEKPFPVKTFEMTKSGMEQMLYYIGELAKDGDLVNQEAQSRIGYLEKFVDYLSCDLPTQTTEQLELFRFFRELENGRINQENFDVSAEKVQKYLDAEKIQKLTGF